MTRPIYNRIALIGLCLVALFFGLYRLTESPPVWYDEGWYIQTAANLQSVGIDGVQLMPGAIEHVSILTVGYPFIYPLALWMNLFGSNILVVRLFMVICILAFIAGAACLARRMWGMTTAVGVCALIATLPTLYGNGKSVLGEVPGLVYLVLFLIIFHTALKTSRHRRHWLMLSAVCAGLCVVTKPLFIVLLPAIVLVIALEFRRKNVTAPDAALAAIAGLVPLVVWVLIQFKGSDSLSAVLGFYANPYGIRDMGTVIVENMKHLVTDIGNLYLSVTMIVWIAALGLRIRLKERVSSEEIIAFVFSVLVILAFLRTAGWYRYLFPAQAIALIFLPHALHVLTTRMQFSWMHRAVPFVIGALALIGIYQLGFDSWVAQAYANHRTAEWQEYFRDMPASVNVFFYNTPEVAIFVPHQNYYQYFQAAGIELGQSQLTLIQTGRPDIVVTETDAYETHKDLFARYNTSRQIGKYSILTVGP